MNKGIKTKLDIPTRQAYPCLAWYNLIETSEPLADDDIFLLTFDKETEETICTNLVKGGSHITKNESDYTRLPVGTVFALEQK